MINYSTERYFQVFRNEISMKYTLEITCFVIHCIVIFKNLLEIKYFVYFVYVVQTRWYKRFAYS